MRQPIPEAGEPLAPIVGYQPRWAAYVFALLSLPLCVLYVPQARSRLWEGLLLWFVLNTVTYTKDFSYLRLPQVPVFVTDIVLAGFVLALCRRWGLRWLKAGHWWTRLLAGYFVVGLVSLARGLERGDTVLLALRDSALVAYPLFVFVGVYFVTSWESLLRVYVMFAAGAALATLNGVSWFLAEPDQRRFVAFAGSFVVVALIGTVVLTQQGFLGRTWGWSLAAVLATGVLLSNSRTAYVTLGLGLLLVAIAAPLRSPKARWRAAKAVGCLALITCFSACILARTSAGSAFLDRSRAELLSGTVDYERDPNAVFRLLAWSEAWQRFSEHPWLGEGYAVPFIFNVSSGDARPHNTYLTVLYKMGVLGLAPLLALLAYFHWRGWAVLRQAGGGIEAWLLYVLLLGQVVMALFAFFNLWLESPFTASIFWLTLGAGIRAIEAVTLRSPPISAT